MCFKHKSSTIAFNQLFDLIFAGTYDSVFVPSLGDMALGPGLKPIQSLFTSAIHIPQWILNKSAIRVASSH